jgi:hypothetical protein
LEEVNIKKKRGKGEANRDSILQDLFGDAVVVLTSDFTADTR